MSIPESLKFSRIQMWEHAVNENAEALAAGIDEFDAAIAAVDNSDLVGSAREEADKWIEHCTSDAYRFRANSQRREVTEV
tara:strand:+ start:1541 stop:1780 length:240 start_codon:yes stop_codon:yes gene_type:complete